MQTCRDRKTAYIDSDAHLMLPPRFVIILDARHQGLRIQRLCRLPVTRFARLDTAQGYF